MKFAQIEKYWEKAANNTNFSNFGWNNGSFEYPHHLPFQHLRNCVSEMLAEMLDRLRSPLQVCLINAYVKCLGLVIGKEDS